MLGHSLHIPKVQKLKFCEKPKSTFDHFHTHCPAITHSAVFGMGISRFSITFNQLT